MQHLRASCSFEIFPIATRKSATTHVTNPDINHVATFLTTASYTQLRMNASAFKSNFLPESLVVELAVQARACSVVLLVGSKI
jgi:hypothetical protein